MKRLRIKLTRERNDLLFANLVALRLKSIANFQVFEITLAHGSIVCPIAEASATCKISRGFPCHWSRVTYHIFERAVSSAVEHLVYTEEVGGSKPSPPMFIASTTPAPPEK